MQRVFIKVIGFSDAERHALNTLFRLSEERQTGYAPWSPEFGWDAQIALIDGESHEALVEFESPSHQGLKTIWVGATPHPRAWRSFQRPIDWPQVISLMDQVFMPPRDIEVDLDFDSEDAQDTQPPAPSAPARRALIANADRAERLYIRARMSLADLTQADEADTVPGALELARNNRYDVAVVDFGLPGGKGVVELVRELARTEQGIPSLIVTKSRLSPAEKARALLGRQPILIEKPVDPLKLTALLRRV